MKHHTYEGKNESSVEVSYVQVSAESANSIES
jgi:hypothetical protein